MSLDDAIESLDAYVTYGRPTGGFLQAVLCNDLMGAVGAADETSLANLLGICRYVYNDMPANCHGSSQAVAAWLSAHAKRRAREAQQP